MGSVRAAVMALDSERGGAACAWPLHTAAAREPSYEYAHRLCRVWAEQGLCAGALLVLGRVAILWTCAADAIGGRMAARVLRHLLLVAAENLVRGLPQRPAQRCCAAAGAGLARILTGWAGGGCARAGSCLACSRDPAGVYRHWRARPLAGRSAQ